MMLSARALLAALVLAVAMPALGAVTKQFVYDPTVPLSHCMAFGPLNAYQFEWNIDSSVRRVLEMRFTANVQRGFTSFGFTHLDKLQLVSGYPPESLDCSRRLFDNYSPYNLDGNVYGAYPETPANTVTTNISHVQHYVMRNLSTSAKQMLDAGGSLATNITLLWGYGIESMYSDACYHYDMSTATEFAQMVITFTDSRYLKVNGSCPTYNGTTTSYQNRPQLKAAPAKLLDSELNQNTRMAGLLVGGDMLLQTGRATPEYVAPPGYVEAGENYANSCQSSLTVLKMRWRGFADKVGGIQRYLVTAGTAAKPSLYLDRASAGTNEAFTFSGLKFARNETLYVMLSAVNFAGLATDVRLPAMRILNNNEPVFGTVLDGSVGDTLNGAITVSYIAVTDRIAAHWANYTDQDHSTIDSVSGTVTENGYQYAVGIYGQNPDSFIPWTTIVGVFESEKILTGLTLTHGTRYYFTVRSRNCAGVNVLATSPGVTVDVVSPARGRVYFSNRTYYQAPKVKRSSQLFVSWIGFSDVTSGIAYYEYAIGKTPKPLNGATNLGMIVNWTSTGTSTRTSNPTRILSLPPAIQLLVPLGTLLYAYVKATDRAGNWAIAHSNATLVVGN